MLDVDQALTQSGPHYARTVGARLEPVGSMWAAWSPASGETHILNDESAAVLELLAEHEGLSSQEAAKLLASETGIDVHDLERGIGMAWIPLEMAGLVRRVIVTSQ